MQHPHLPKILSELHNYLKSLYGKRLESVMLYGSQARGEADIDSDIDVMVILNGTVDAWAEIELTGEFMADLCLDYSVVICNVFMPNARYKAKDCALIRNVAQEGIALL